MGLYEQIRDVAKVRGYSVNRLEQELGFARSSINKFNKNAPSADKLQKIAETLGVTVDYLMTGKEEVPGEESELNVRDRRDIAKDLDRIMGEIKNEDDGPLFYNGQPLNPEDMIFLSKAIEAALTDAKKKNKVTYNSHKNRPRK